MEGLGMKYFVLNPKSKTKDDMYAQASRRAMVAYADGIKEVNERLAADLYDWAARECSVNLRR